MTDPPPKVGTLLKKCLWCCSVLIKSQGNVIKAGIRHSVNKFCKQTCSTFCRAYAYLSFWFLDVVLVFDREVLLCSLSKPAIQRSSEEQLLWKFLEKSVQRKLLCSKAASSMAKACKFTLYKVFPVLILFLSLTNLTEFTFYFIWSVTNGGCNDNKTIHTLCFISLVYGRRLQL